MDVEPGRSSCRSLACLLGQTDILQSNGSRNSIIFTQQITLSLLDFPTTDIKAYFSQTRRGEIRRMKGSHPLVERV